MPIPVNMTETVDGEWTFAAPSGFQDRGMGEILTATHDAIPVPAAQLRATKRVLDTRVVFEWNPYVFV